jgi:hypothetical protein
LYIGNVTSCSRALLEKLIVFQLISAFSTFIEPEVSLLPSKDHAAGHCPNLIHFTSSNPISKYIIIFFYI